MWILDSHPFAPPICFLKPTVNMGILVGKHVDAHGRIYLPYLQNWSHVREGRADGRKVFGNKACYHMEINGGEWIEFGAFCFLHFLLIISM